MEPLETQFAREHEKDVYINMSKDYGKYDLERPGISQQKPDNELMMHGMVQGPTKVQDETVRCNICDKTFPRQANLTRHEKIHYKFKESEHFPCHLCQKKFTSKQRLVFHIRNHSDKIYKCMMCLRKFGKPNNCDICKLQGNLLACPHTTPPYACEDCDKKFTYAPIQHSFMLPELPFTCKFCNEKLADIKVTRRHVDTHSEKPFSCNTCGKSYPSRWKLRLHEQTHFELTPYKCYMCPQRFNNTGNFKRHMKRVHSAT